MRDIPCRIDLSAIEKWELDFAAGKNFKKAPPGATCQECKAKKSKCLLPWTIHLRGEPTNKRKCSDSVAGDAPKTKRSWVVEKLEWVPFVLNIGAEFVSVVQGHEEVEAQITLENAWIADALERIIDVIEDDEPYVSPTEWTSGSESEEDATEGVEGDLEGDLEEVEGDLEGDEA